MSDDLIAKISQTMNITQKEQLIFIFITKLTKGHVTQVTGYYCSY